MRHANKVLGTMAAVVAVAVIYFAVYLALVIPRKDGFDPDHWNETGFSMRSVATYRWGGDVSLWLFVPANELDRRMRPKTWEFDPFADLPPGWHGS